MSATSPWLCKDPEPHEPHEFTTAGLWFKCPGIEDLAVASCPDDEPHEDHDWRADPLEDLRHCPGVDPDADPHELTFIWAFGQAHPVQIRCRCGDVFQVVGP